MSDSEWAELAGAMIQDFRGQRARVEARRARASEAALLARVAELEAEVAGMTGTPMHEGRYWCEVRKGKMWYQILEWRNGDGWGRWGYTVLRFWRLPGETYTATPQRTEATP